MNIVNSREITPEPSTHREPRPRRVAGLLGCALWVLTALGCQGGPATADGGGDETGCDPDAGDAGDEGEAAGGNWWELELGDPILDQVALFYLGHAWDQSADVAEVLETLGRIDGTDDTSWPHEWQLTAERLDALAGASEAEGHALSAADAYLRAATYYRAALHRHGDPADPEVPVLAERAVERFEKYLELSDSPCESVTFPYEDTTLPAYFCRADTGGEPAPVLLFQEGRDAWAEDGKFVADAALRRGYHVLMFDGPGMGKVLRLQGLPFRHDWEAVVSPAVDFVEQQPEVDPDRIGYIALSMGGFLGTRAAAFEPRLSLLVVNPGVLRWNEIYEGFFAEIDPDLPALVDTDEEAFNAAIEELMQHSELIRWGVIDSMWHHGVDTPAALIHEVRKFSLTGQESMITAKVLVVDAEAETWGQSPELFEALPGDKDYLLFTASEAAQFHVQPGASGVATHRVFDWIDSNI